MSKLNEIRSRKVYVTRTHNTEEYPFSIVQLVLKARSKHHTGDDDKLPGILQDIQRGSIRQIMQSGYGDWQALVDECLDEEEMQEVFFDDHALIQMIAFAALYGIDNTNVWHIANIAAIAMVLESKL